MEKHIGKFKSKKSIIGSAILLVAFAIIVEVIFYNGFLHDGHDGTIAFLLITLFFAIPLLVGGIVLVRKHFESAQSIQNALDAYGKENIIKLIENSTKLSFQYPFSNRKMYFTDKLVIDPRIAIFSYSDINTIYKEVSDTKRGYIASMAFKLHDGNTFYLCSGINDELLLKFMKFCYQQNPYIVIGESDLEDEGKYTVPDETGFPVPIELTPAGHKFQKSFALIFLGIMFLIVPMLFILLLPLSLNSRLDKKINAVTGEERDKFLAEGYTEYKVMGKYLYKDVSYAYGDEEYGFKDLYVYDLENEEDLYLGVVGKFDYRDYDTSVCDGFEIFYNGEVLKDEISGGNKSYKVDVIKESNISNIYGIPSKKSQEEKTMNLNMCLILFVPMMVVGLVLLIVGIKVKRKNSLSN